MHYRSMAKTEMMIMATCGGQDETWQTLRWNCNLMKSVGRGRALETLKKIKSSKRLFWSRWRYRRYGGESEVWRVYRGHAQKNLLRFLSWVEVLVVLEVPRRYNLVVGLGLMKRRMSFIWRDKIATSWSLLLNILLTVEDLDKLVIFVFWQT